MPEDKGKENLYSVHMSGYRKEYAYKSIICVLKFVEENIKIFLGFY